MAHPVSTAKNTVNVRIVGQIRVTTTTIIIIINRVPLDFV